MKSVDDIHSLAVCFYDFKRQEADPFFSSALSSPLCPFDETS